MRTHARTHTHAHAHMHAHKRTRARAHTHTHTHACTHARTHARKHARTHTHTHTEWTSGKETRKKNVSRAVCTNCGRDPKESCKQRIWKGSFFISNLENEFVSPSFLGKMLRVRPNTKEAAVCNDSKLPSKDLTVTC